MRSSLRAAWLSVRASYWFLPTLMTLAAFALAMLTIHLDRIWGSEWLLEKGWFEGSRPEGARAQLTVIASAMIAISSTVFAITISAVAFASGNYGPRLLTNFMNDRGNQVSLGVFIATFVYNLTVLRVVRNPEDAPAPGESAAEAVSAFVPQLSMLVSGTSVLIAVAVLVFFLHHVPASIRVNTVLGGIGRHLIRDIEAHYPAESGAREPEAPPRGTPVSAASVGYVKIIDFAALDSIAREEGRAIALKVRTGDFSHPHVAIAELSGGPVDARLTARIRACFSFGDSRTASQNLQFLIDELVEIAMRALSPGRNDPYTALTAIHWLGAALAKLADRDLGAGPEEEDYDPERVRPVADDFRHYLRRGFGALRASAATNSIASAMFLDALAGVAAGAASADRLRTIADEAHALMAQAEEELKGPALADVRDAFAAFQEQIAGKTL
ncbi:MAG TPA: DUF2254 domain-containing protein [Allosphingosinicella sp.]